MTGTGLFGAIGPGERPLALGAMRLSTAPDRDEERGVRVLHAAFDAGARLVDTADAYGRDERDVGHNERLVARAVSTWTGDRGAIRIATKGGLTRPGGRWIPDGRARHLTAACEASRRALGVPRIFLYLLHAPDPRTPLATSVRALAALKRAGTVEHVGLSNVGVAQIEEALGIVEVAAIEVELSLWRPDALRSGVVEFCVSRGIPVLAHRPLGGADRKARVLREPLLQELAAAHGVTPFDVALAWILDLSPLVIPLPGPTRVETARALAASAGLRLSDEDRARLDERFPAGRRLRGEASSAPPSAVGRSGEVVLVMGIPGAGKSTLARGFVERGYARLNRDETGGRLSGLLPSLDRLLRSGAERVVLDNTYVTRKSRAEVLECAHAAGRDVRCVFVRTEVADAQVNAVERMVRRYGRLLEPEELGRLRDDPGAFGPGVPARQQRQLEPPDPAEGFAAIEEVAFVRQPDPGRTHRAVVLWTDGVLWRSRSGRGRARDADDVEILPGRRERLASLASEGFHLAALAWRPEIAEGTARAEDVLASFDRLRERLALPIEFLHCPHGGGPPVCWCRKPLPGLLALLLERHRLDPAACLYVGDGNADRAFAGRLGLGYRTAEEFFPRS